MANEQVRFYIIMIEHQYHCETWDSIINNIYISVGSEKKKKKRPARTL